MKLRLYSIGYQGRTLPEIVAILQRERVGLLVDVRETAWSHKPGFSKAALEAGLRAAGVEYLHARFAGNPKALRRDLKDHDAALTRFESYLTKHPDVIRQLDEVIRKGGKKNGGVCLMCYERHPADCHRSILLQHWRLASEDCSPITHLEPDGAPRFTTRTIATPDLATQIVGGTRSR